MSKNLLYKGTYNRTPIFAKIFDNDDTSLITEKTIYKYIQDNEKISENYFIKYFYITESIAFNNDFKFKYLKSTIKNEDRTIIFNDLIRKFKNVLDSSGRSYTEITGNDLFNSIYDNIMMIRAPSFNEEEYNAFKNKLILSSKRICDAIGEGYINEYNQNVHNKKLDISILDIINNNIRIIKINKNRLLTSIIDVQHNLDNIVETIEIIGTTINKKTTKYNNLINYYNLLLKSPNYLLFNLDIKYYLYYINNIYKKIILKLLTIYTFKISKDNERHFTNYFKFIPQYNLNTNEDCVTILKTNLDNTIIFLSDNYNYRINCYDEINKLIKSINYEDLNLNIIITEYCNFPTLENYNIRNKDDLVTNFDHFIFELFYGIYVMNEKLNVIHNDTHDKNILLEKNTNEENHTYTFIYDDINYSFTKKKYYNIKFIDFDNSSVFNKENLITNEKLKKYIPYIKGLGCKDSGKCNKKTLKDTLYTLVIILWHFHITSPQLNKIKRITNNSNLCDEIIKKIKQNVFLHGLCFFKKDQFIFDQCDREDTDLNPNLNAQILFNIYNPNPLLTSNLTITSIVVPSTIDPLHGIDKKYLKYLKYKNKYLKLKNNIN